MTHFKTGKQYAYKNNLKKEQKQKQARKEITYNLFIIQCKLNMGNLEA